MSKLISQKKPIFDKFFAKTRGNIEPGAERLHFLMEKNIKNFFTVPVILVGGTNGKGSTCAYIESMLRTSYLKVGLYTSPHLIRPTERIKINGQEITEDDLGDSLERWEKCAALNLPNATFFEIMSAAAFDYFFHRNVDIAVVEVGLGGRFDSCNALHPLLSVLTSVGLDHKDVLGEDLEKIAFDKAHIGRRGRPLLLGELGTEAMAGVRKAEEKIGFNPKQARKFNQVQLQALENLQKKSGFYLENAKLAVSAVSILQTILPFEVNWILGLEKTKWPGRFDLRQVNGRRILFDVSHNDDGLKFFAKELFQKKFSAEKSALLFGCLKDKNWSEMLKTLPTIASEFIFTQPSDHRGQNPFELMPQLSSNFTASVVKDPSVALEKLFLSKKELLVITGSIAFVGEIMTLLCLEPFENEQSTIS